MEMNLKIKVFMKVRTDDEIGEKEEISASDVSSDHFL